MRFELTTLPLKSLSLDEDNYRFKSATDQADCIKKIYERNPSYFLSLMESLAKDDVGEPLLVFKDTKKNIVLDGNRRLSALIVLQDSDKAPNPSARKKSNELKAINVIDFDKIAVQISADKTLIQRTVFERHAGSEGVRRQNWSALAAARFRLMEGEDIDWRVTLLILELEKEYPKYSEYINTKFSYEVFKRIVLAALNQNIIDKNIFKADQKGIKKKPTDNYQHTMTTASAFIDSMIKGDLNLSRKDENTYADKKKVNEYLAKFPVAPEQPCEPEKPSKLLTQTDKDSHTNSNQEPNNIKSSEQVASPPIFVSTPTSRKPSISRKTKLSSSEEMVQALDELDHPKLNSLYRSVTTISVVEHTAMVHVACWTIFEVVTVLLGKGESASTSGFIKGHQSLKDFFSGLKKDDLKDIQASVDTFVDIGNRTKHSGDYVPDPQALIDHFTNAEHVLLLLVKALISKPY